MYRISKTFSKSAEDLFRTTVAIGVATASLNQGHVGFHESLIILGGALTSALWVGFKNYIKNRLK